MRDDKPIRMVRTARPAFGASDALIILAALGIGIGAYWIDQEVLESWLGFDDNVARGDTVVKLFEPRGALLDALL